MSNKFTLMFIVISLVLIYALIEYMNYKNKTFDVLNKVREGNILTTQEQQVWKNLTDYMNTLKIYDAQAQQYEIERRATNAKNLIIGGTIATVVGTIACTIFFPPAAPLVSAGLTATTQLVAKQQLK